MKNTLAATAAGLLACLVVHGNATAGVPPDSHAPIGVMGDHYHKKGEWMFSYRYMYMDMRDNRDGRTDLSPEEIVTTAANPFAGMPMMPPKLRVVPTRMNMEMHMLGVMYAPGDRVTLMGMFNYLDKEMDHVVFMGGTGTTRLGTFTTRTKGIGDTELTGLIRLDSGENIRMHLSVGVSAPTGDIEETDNVLTPMNTHPTLRLPYPMQLGSGTWDVITGLTIAGGEDVWGWGGQLRSKFRTGENDEDYTLGDEHSLTAWISYRVRPHISLSSRIEYIDRNNIDGIDPAIRAPVQTADPDRQAMQRIDFSVGVNYVFSDDSSRLAFEIAAPVSQRLDGPQLETDWQATFGWQYAL